MHLLFPRPRLIALDRDGVINRDSSSYIKSPAEWVPIEDNLLAIAQLTNLGYPIVVVTNQAGVGRGYFTLQTLAAIHSKMLAMVTQVGGKIDAIFFCPHQPEVNCYCRKPRPGLLLQAATQFALTPQEILMVGDSFSDVEAAQNCGAQSFFLATETKPQDLIQARVRNISFGNTLAELIPLLAE